MFSNSNSYLGGSNSGRPGQPGYGQSPFSTVQQGQQQPNGFAPQPTGFNNAPMQQQYTGYPPSDQQQNLQAPQQQPQYTGFQPQSQQPPQQQSFQTGQAPPPQVPQKTGQTSAQIAQSFSASPAAQPPSTQQAAVKGAKIPKIRLSFLTATDQAKFEQLFKSAVGDGQALDGEKVKDLLIRSKLPGSDLMQIWVLSDTTKSGQLLFPEFALAMYLCNLKLTGKQLPQALPEIIANEVSSMVDIISFGIPDDRSQAQPSTNAPNFNASSSAPTIQQPQPQASNSQLLNQLTLQPTGFASQYIPPQPTGFGQQQTGFGQPQGGFNQQQQNQQMPQATGYTGPRPPMPPMPTGYGSNLSPSQTGPAMPLNAQPTGRPGQWGLVNAPASGLPNIDLLQQRMMPQPGREGGFTTQGLTGGATVPWAVTKDEKKIYDQLFKAWDGFNKGFIGGDVAIEVMGQSGLPKPDLEKIWTLADPGNKGRLDMDEFAVAMHLIYRKLNGYPVPNKLPPELVPPSTRNFADSIGTVKSLLSQDAETRKNTGTFLQPQKTGVSYLKSHSFRNESNGITPQRKDATIFRNNDDDIGYRSSARRRVGGPGRTPSPALSTSPVSERSNDDLSLEQLRKKIREKEVLLDAIDFKGEKDAEEDDGLDRKDRRDAEDLYRRIRRIQEDIDSHPSAALRSGDSDAERRNLKRQLQRLTDRLPELASQVRKTERNIADAQLELFRMKDAKANPGSASAIVGTGPGGAVTESDRLKARAKAMMQQRSAALTGKGPVGGSDDSASASRRLEEERSKINNDKENNERMVRDVEESVRDFSQGLEDSLAQGKEDSTSEHERRRWADALGVEDEVRDFIFDLQRSSRSAKVRRDESGSDRATRNTSHQDHSRDATPTRQERTSTPTETSRPAAAPSTGSYSSYKTAEDRAAFIKQQAEQRMAERLAALGLKPPSKSGESTQQRQEREAREREDRVRQAEAEDAKRDQERQRRLADEHPSPPSVKSGAKKPLPPPSRKSRADSGAQRVDAKKKTEEDALAARAEQEGKEKAIRDQQQAQAAQTREMENEADTQEDDLVKEQEAKLAALEEQVKQGKIKKQEEKRRKEAAKKEAKEKEAKLAAQRVKLEEAKERERQLQLQLESLGDDSSSDDDGPQNITPQDTTPTSSQVLSRDASSAPSESAITSPPVAPQITPPSVPSLPKASSTDSGSKNPFFKQMQQASEAATPATSFPATSPPQQPTSITSPPAADVSTNPFHRLAQQEATTAPAPTSQTLPPPLTSTPTGSRNRVRQEEDEWSVVESSDNSDDEAEEDRPDRGSAKHLASILFGTMGPPRPMSAMDEKPMSPAPDSPHTPSTRNFGSPTTAPPPPPPMPGSNAPSAPPPPPPMPGAGPPSAPPPPPPMPGGFPSDSAPSGAPPPPPPPSMPAAPRAGAPDRSGLLGDIASMKDRGTGLKKVHTKDRSQASTAGRVL